MPDLTVSETDIAIIGISSRLPGSKNSQEFWQNLQDGKECIAQISADQLRAGLLKSLGYVPEAELARWLSNPNYISVAAVLEDIDLFDAGFFGYNPTEAALIDPQQRLFLECAWEALEDAAYDPDTYRGLIGVYAGSEMNTYHHDLHMNIIPSVNVVSRVICNANDYLATRVCYKLNLKGPGITIQTACSTSLVAVHVACQSLKSGECDMALAGSVVARSIQETGYLYQEDGILSPDGHCRPFDAQGQGTLFANGGVGVVVLKRLVDALADGDNIYAVIKGSAANNDGSFKTGYTAPAIAGQVRVLLEAMAVAAVEPDSISYVETHGTATPLGDPIEIAALSQAFRTSTQRKRFCAIGSLKSNMGHLGAVAGVAGLIKTSLALKHKMLPPSLHYERPNPQIDFANSPFYVNTQLAAWQTDAQPRRAGVSSFGMGGTNAHVILEEAPELDRRHDERSGRSSQLLVLSARTGPALERMRANLLNYLKDHPDLNLADLAFTLQVGRKAFSHRLTLVCKDVAEAVNQLEAKRGVFSVVSTGEHPVVFMFPGQGPQYVNMGRELYEEEPVFRQQVDMCAKLLLPHLHGDLREIIYPPVGQEEHAQKQLDRMSLAQPAIFVIEYAMAQLWMQRGLHPQAMIGHSIGEYAAACVAGVLSLQDALFLVCLRGRLMEQLPAGAMLAVSLPEEQIVPLLNSRLALAAHNSTNDCVVSGPTDAIELLERQLTERHITCRLLRVSRASHSQMMEPALEQFTREVRKLSLHPPRLPYISNLTGKWITEQEATDPGYWARHWRQTVRFAEGIQLLLADSTTILLEVGPGRTLSTLAQRMEAPDKLILPSLRHPQAPVSDMAFLLNTCGQLWCAGVSLDWAKLFIGTQPRRLSLPTYPFERERYWIFPGQQIGASSASATANAALLAGKKPDLAEWFSVPSWKRSPLPGAPSAPEQRKPADCWLIFTDTLGLGAGLISHLLAEKTPADSPATVITVHAGTQFRQQARSESQASWEFTIRPQQREDYELLLREISSHGLFPNRIVHLWTLITPDQVPDEYAYFETAQASGFYSLLFLTQALGTWKSAQPLEIALVSNNLQEVTGGEVLCPARATALGISKVAPYEYRHISWRNIDVVLSTDPTQRQLAARVLTELRAQPAETNVAYRGPHRWVQSFEYVRLEAEAQDCIRLRQEGVYLITGGLGGIGLALAEDLARRVKAKVILTARTAFPARAEWNRLLATASEHDATASKIRQIMMLEESGAQVLVMQADVTDLAQMRTIMARIRERFGALHGVIHTAGLPGGGLMQLKTAEAAADVLAPKVKGALVLEAVLQDMRPDFLALCSSLYSVIGGVGQVDYCAANLFLDNFAFYHTARTEREGRPLPTISINWDGWQKIGMAVDILTAYEKASLNHAGSQAEKRLQAGILPREGVEAFRRILAHAVASQVIVSPKDIHALQAEALSPLLDLEDDGRESIAPLSTLHQRPNLQTPYVPPRDETEQQIAAIWQKTLGIEQIGVQDNFFEAGGDSLMGLRMINQLRQICNIDLSIHLLFARPTVADMAKIIRQEHDGEQKGDDDLAELLQSVSQMSEEEALLLLEKDFSE